MSKLLYKVVLLSIFLVILGSAIAVPFAFESQTLWYKTGLDKLMLRTGQLFGMTALSLIFLQIVLAVKGKILENIFGPAGLMRCHRINGLFLSFFAFVHILLVLLPEGIANLPLGLKFWPEMIGGILFWVILSMAVSSTFRERLHIDYKRWRAIHKPLGYLSFVLVVVHVIFVSDTFEQATPKIVILLLSISLIIWIISQKFLVWWSK